MSVTVDREPLPVADLGLETVGQVLSHLQRDSRLVVQLLIDGEEPELAQMTLVRQTPLAGRTVFIETADPRALAIGALEEVAIQVREAEACKGEAAEMLQANDVPKALELLSACLLTWQDAQTTVHRCAALLRLDLDAIRVRERSLQRVLEELAEPLRQIKSALEQRDYVLLGDVLQYETAATTDDWLASIHALAMGIPSSE